MEKLSSRINDALGKENFRETLKKRLEKRKERRKEGRFSEVLEKNFQHGEKKKR